MAKVIIGLLFILVVMILVIILTLSSIIITNLKFKAELERTKKC